MGIQPIKMVKFTNQAFFKSLFLFPPSSTLVDPVPLLCLCLQLFAFAFSCLCLCLQEKKTSYKEMEGYKRKRRHYGNARRIRRWHIVRLRQRRQAKVCKVRTTFNHITSHYTNSSLHHITSHRIKSHHIAWHKQFFTSHHITLHYIAFDNITPNHTTHNTSHLITFDAVSPHHMALHHIMYHFITTNQNSTQQHVTLVDIFYIPNALHFGFRSPKNNKKNKKEGRDGQDQQTRLRSKMKSNFTLNYLPKITCQNIKLHPQTTLLFTFHHI